MLQAEATSVGRYRGRPMRRCGIVLLAKRRPLKRSLLRYRKRGERYSTYLCAISHERTSKARDMQRGVTDPFERGEFVKNDESIMGVIFPFYTILYEIKQG